MKGEVNMSVFRGRGFKAHQEEQQRREKEKEKRKGRVWRFFLQDGEEDVPIRFLTEEPILFYEHTIKTPDGKYDNVTCMGDDCEYCERGNRPSYKGAWLVVDGREIEVEEKKDGKPTGKTKIIKDRVKLYVRGSTDIAKLDRLSRKWGLTTRPWFANKTGSGTSTSYELDSGEPSELTVKEIQQLLSQLKEEVSNHYDGTMESLYDIVEYYIFDDVQLGNSSEKSSSNVSDDEDDGEAMDLDEGVQSIDDEEESKKTLAKKKKKKIFKRK